MNPEKHGRYATEVRRAAIPEILRVSDVAVAVGVSRRTISRWITSGILRGVRIGRIWLCRRGDLLNSLRPGAVS